MSLSFALLGSGSEGNGLLVRSGATLVMVDCGFSRVETERRLTRLGVSPDEITVLLVTHEHGDHMGGVAAFSERWNCPVWGSYGTLKALEPDFPDHLKAVIVADQIKKLPGLDITPYSVPHDSREPLQFTFRSAQHKLGLLTDAGSVTSHMEYHLQDCHALILETNYEPEWLERGPYPQSLKDRVRGPYGHLSNQDAALLLSRVLHSQLKWVVAAHISHKNNAKELALDALSKVWDRSDSILMADQKAGLEWISCV
jgi:phosphoribosyl 1,2-cyclic phosphodiesterase